MKLEVKHCCGFLSLEFGAKLWGYVGLIGTLPQLILLVYVAYEINQGLK
jgi:hypothetical protein